MSFAPSRLDFFAAAALTGLLANGHQFAMAPKAAAQLAAELVRELDGQAAAAEVAKPKNGAFKAWAVILTRALAKIKNTEVVRETNNIDVFFGEGLLLSVCRDLVWIHLPETPTAQAAGVVNLVLESLGLPHRVNLPARDWFLLAPGGTALKITAAPVSITR